MLVAQRGIGPLSIRSRVNQPPDCVRRELSDEVSYRYYRQDFDDKNVILV